MSFFENSMISDMKKEKSKYLYWF